MKSCGIGKYVTNTIKSNNIDFQNIKDLQNPMKFRIKQRHSLLNLKIAVWDYVDVDVFQRVDYMSSYIKVERHFAWKIINLKGRVSSMFLQLKMYCNQNYYGSTCKTYCIPTNSEKGHYKCDKNTGRKKCYTGWTGENCHVNQDDCSSSRCHSSATCIDGVNYYTCLCPPERTGTTCDILLYKTTARLIQTASTYQTKSTSVSHDEDSQKSVSHVTTATTTSRHLSEASTFTSDSTLKVKLNVTAAKTSKSPPVTKEFHADTTSDTTIPSKATDTRLPDHYVSEEVTELTEISRTNISTTRVLDKTITARENETDFNVSSVQPTTTSLFITTSITQEEYSTDIPANTTISFTQIKDSTDSVTTGETVRSDSTSQTIQHTRLGTEGDVTKLMEKTSFGINETETENVTLVFGYKISTSDHLTTNISSVAPVESDITSSTLSTVANVSDYYVSEDITTSTEINRTDISSQTSETTMSHSSPKQPTDRFLFTEDFIDQFNTTTEKGPSKSENITDFSREYTTDKLNQTVESSTTLQTRTISKDDEIFYTDTKTVEAISLPSESSRDTSSVPAIPQSSKTFSSIQEGKTIYPATEPTSTRIETPDSWVENVTIQTSQETSTDFTKILETQSVSSVSNYTGYSATDYDTSKMSTEEGKELKTEVLFTIDVANTSIKSSSELTRFVSYPDNVTSAFQGKTSSKEGGEETMTSSVITTGVNETYFSVSPTQSTSTSSLFPETAETKEEYSTHTAPNGTVSFTPIKDFTDSVTRQTSHETEDNATKLMEKTSYGINETEIENVTLVFGYKISTSDHLATNISSVAPVESDITSSTLSTDAKVSDYHVSEDITTSTEINRTDISSQTSETTMSHSSPRQPTDRFLFTEDFIDQFNTTTEKGPSKSENITDFSREYTTDKLNQTVESSTTLQTSTISKDDEIFYTDTKTVEAISLPSESSRNTSSVPAITQSSKTFSSIQEGKTIYPATEPTSTRIETPDSWVENVTIQTSQETSTDFTKILETQSVSSVSNYTGYSATDYDTSKMSTEEGKELKTEVLFTIDVANTSIKSSSELTRFVSYPDNVTSAFQGKTSSKEGGEETMTSSVITTGVNETYFSVSPTQSTSTSSLFPETAETKEEYSTHTAPNGTVSFTPIKDFTDSVTRQTSHETEDNATKLMEKTSFGINETEIENVTLVFGYKISTSDHLTTNISSVAPVESDITSSILSTVAKVSGYYVSEDITTSTEINRTDISSQTSETTMSHSSPKQPTDRFLFTEDFIDQFNTTTEKGPSKSENITDFSREYTTDKLNQTVESSTTLQTSTISKDDEIFYTDTKTVEAISLPSESSRDTSSVPAITQSSKTFSSIQEGKTIYPATEPTSTRIETPDSWVENVTIQTSQETSTDFTKLLETQSVSSVSNYTGYSATDYNTSKMSTEEGKELKTEVLFTTESTNISTQSSLEVSRFVPYLDNITETVTSSVTIVGENETDTNVSSVQPTTTSLFLTTNITQDEYSTHIPANTTISFTPIKDSTDSVTTGETVRSDSTSQTIQHTRLGTEGDVTKLMEKTSFGINETETENVTLVFGYKISTSDHLTTNISSVAPVESDITSSTLSTVANVSDYYVSEDITTSTEINRTDISSQTPEATMSYSSPRQPTDHFLFTEDFIDQFNTTTEKGPSKSENITDFSREYTTDKLSYTTESSASSSSKANITDEVSRTAEFIDKSNIYNLTESIISNTNATTYSSDHITTTLMSEIINITTYRPKTIEADSDFRTTQFAIHDTTPSVTLANQYISSAATISIQNATAKIGPIASDRTRATSLSYSISNETTKLPEKEITTATTKMLTTLPSSTISTRPSKIKTTMKPSIKVCISVRIKIPKTVANANKIRNPQKLSKRLCWIVNKLSMFKFPDQSSKKLVATDIASSISWLSKSMTAIIPPKHKYTFFITKMIVNWVQRRLRLFFNFNWLSVHQFKSTCIVLVIKPATVGKAAAQQPNPNSGSVGHKQLETLKLKVCRPAKQLPTTTSTRLTTTKSSLTTFKYENKTHVDKKIIHPGNPAITVKVVSTAKPYYHYGKNVIVKIYRKNQRIFQRTLTRLSNLWRGVNQITNRLYQPATNRKQGIRRLWNNAWLGAQKAYKKSQLLLRKTYTRVVLRFSSMFDQAKSTTATNFRQYYNSYRNYYNSYITQVQNTAQYFKNNYDYYTKNLRNYWNRYVT
ncbi:mucin-5AC-like [Octopus vulgaris]|uniref:Delta-like protein n=1 Tax=Octopus vulgaris TaxID=6645 RepID=A0AA36BCG9_OCTVU|nr:mucin-5AC-like [Octopus vulgaris]